MEVPSIRGDPRRRFGEPPSRPAQGRNLTPSRSIASCGCSSARLFGTAHLDRRRNLIVRNAHRRRRSGRPAARRDRSNAFGMKAWAAASSRLPAAEGIAPSAHRPPRASAPTSDLVRPAASSRLIAPAPRRTSRLARLARACPTPPLADLADQLGRVGDVAAPRLVSGARPGRSGARACEADDVCLAFFDAACSSRSVSPTGSCRSSVRLTPSPWTVSSHITNADRPRIRRVHAVRRRSRRRRPPSSTVEADAHRVAQLEPSRSLLELEILSRSVA